MESVNAFATISVTIAVPAGISFLDASSEFKI